MPLEPGTTLGPYQIDAPLGAGGMGEVYKATDTRLDRTVAIKVLPEHVAADPDLKQRFEREARTVAALNHPHICTLHDIGSQDGIDFLVMEYLDGETVAQRLEKGALPLDQALQIAIEIADALDKAHRQGIVHRDLKPGNIMLTRAGAKLLDFGLAKLKPPEQAGTLSALPTQPANLTQEGSILGTFQYMAPESLEGQEADARTDIFAFGAVVYEIVTGRKAFEGKSQASLIAAILERDPPPIVSLQPVTPTALDRAVKKCLAKEAGDRWQSAKDLCDELKWISESRVDTNPAAASQQDRQVPFWQRRVSVAWPVSIVAVMVAVIGLWNLRTAPPRSLDSVIRFAMTLPIDHPLASGFLAPPLAMSPDGRLLAYVVESRGGFTGELYLRSMDDLEAQFVDAGDAPFFSPDGQWLGYRSEGALKKVPVDGGQVRTICQCLTNPRGFSWARDNDTIVFAPSPLGGIWQVSADGGEPWPLTMLDTSRGESGHHWPELLPGGEALLFTESAEGDWIGGEIIAQQLATGTRKVLIEGATYPRYLPTGHLVYFRQGTLMAAPFDPARLEFTGSEQPIVEGISQNVGTGEPRASFSDMGTLVYLPAESGEALDANSLAWIDRNGVVDRLGAPPRSYLWPVLSPDEERIAVRLHEPRSNIWIYDIESGNLSPFIAGDGANDSPVWSPGGDQIAFSSSRNGPWNLFLKAADFSGTEEPLTTNEYSTYASSFSPDGQWLTFTTFDPASGDDGDVWTLPLEGDRIPEAFHETESFAGGPMFSPSGDWIAYTDNSSGQYEVYVKPFPGPGEPQLVSGGDGGQQPVWSSDGREIFYLGNNGSTLNIVNAVTEPALRLSRPRDLVELERPARASPPLRSVYDVSRDGQRFLFVQENEQPQEPTPLVVVLNWHEELKARVPVP